jgi:anti-anti-sigma regulatory factor
MPPAGGVYLRACGTTRFITVRDEFDVAAADDFDRAVDGALTGRPETLVVDLGMTSLLGATGLRCLRRAQRLAGIRSVRLVVTEVPPAARRQLGGAGIPLALPTSAQDAA